MSEARLILHQAKPDQFIDTEYSIQRVDERGDPFGVVCMFNVPPDPDGDYSKEHAAARSIFDAINSHAALVEALEGLCAALVHDHNRDLPYWRAALAALSLAKGGQS